MMAEISSVVGLVFSRDRAMQLDATLRSFLLHCVDGNDVQIAVLYRATSSLHARQYNELIQEYRPFTNISFQPQAHFRQDVLRFLAAHADLRFGTRLYRRMARLHRRLSFLSQPLLRFGLPRYVLFLVDDNLFVRSLRLVNILDALEEQPQALGFSLRLGRNINYCYTHDLPQPLPEFTTIGDGVLCFDWTHGELDFAYPLEVSSSVYRIADLLPFLNRQRFTNPNQLETCMAQNSGRFHHWPYLLCPAQSVVFSNPVNQVAEQYLNRSGTVHAYTSAELAQRFDQGLRVNIVTYDQLVLQACHQEVELYFYSAERGANAS
ncbi:MAG: hypothetical protein A2W35_16280 [Chloroflexi bacterium RBG_16_57_11]|nr:MAG: hypothetical protein A2W35_16280 [Chloroflexi bacterium RBG_16_57_11]